MSAHPRKRKKQRPIVGSTMTTNKKAFVCFLNTETGLSKKELLSTTWVSKAELNSKKEKFR